MKEAIFKVSFNNGKFSVKNINEEATLLSKEVEKRLPNETLIQFILMSPNSMDMDNKGVFTYEVDLSVKEEVFNDFQRIEDGN